MPGACLPLRALLQADGRLARAAYLFLWKLPSSDKRDLPTSMVRIESSQTTGAGK